MNLELFLKAATYFDTKCAPARRFVKMCGKNEPCARQFAKDYSLKYKVSKYCASLFASSFVISAGISKVTVKSLRRG